MANEHEHGILGFVEEVKSVFHGKREEYEEFIKDIDAFKTLMNDHRITRLPVQNFKGRMKKLLKGHNRLIFGFNAYMKDRRITLPIRQPVRGGHSNGQKKKKVEENCQLPWDLLDIILRNLDFDDLFQFGSVCKNWREFHKIYWRNFMASEEPLLIQWCAVKRSLNFFSLPHDKVYHSKMINNYFRFVYHGSSSGYFIMTRKDNSFILINPFTRRKMLINNSVFQVNFSYFSCKVLLAFSKGSKEFVLVVSCKNSDNLHVYQSRNLCWTAYSTPQKVVDFAVLNSIIYVVTDKASIGILSLKYANINFLELKSTPGVTSSRYWSHVGLVSCDGYLLVLNFMSKVTYNVYKIDFSTMDYVKLESLADIAIFCVPPKRYYALSNPHMWGYENNSIYAIDVPCGKYRVYKGDNKKMPEFIIPGFKRSELPHPIYCRSKQRYIDWCFRHLQYEVDYSLVE